MSLQTVGNEVADSVLGRKNEFKDEL